jgi:hypothetical protein
MRSSSRSSPSSTIAVIIVCTGWRRRSVGVPRDVAVPEHEHVRVGERLVHAHLAPLRRSRLVHDCESHALDRAARDLGQPLAQVRAVVVPVNPQHLAVLLELIEHGCRDPIPRVDHEVRGIRCPQYGLGEALRAPGDVGVGDEQQARRHRFAAAGVLG